MSTDTRLDKLRVLVVEDEFIIAMSMESELQAKGAEVIGPVGTIEDALSAIEASQIDAAILDWYLDGEASEQVADVLMARGIPFALHTGSVLGTEHQVKFAGIPRIGKPSLPNELVNVLRQLIDA